MKYTLEIEQADVELIGEGLDLLPYGKVRPLVERIQPQITAQNAAMVRAAADHQPQSEPAPAPEPTRSPRPRK